MSDRFYGYGRFFVVVSAWCLSCLSASAQAEDRLAQIFQDNMVVQRDMPVPIWGWSSPAAQVEVVFAGQTKAVIADEHGYWRAILDPMIANRDGQTLTVRAGLTTVSRKNILVGEVWIAAGQSNMVHAGADKDTGVYPHYISPGTTGGKPPIRITAFGAGATLTPLPDIEAARRDDKPWESLQEDPAPNSMGPSNYFSRVVRDALDVPVGIIRIAVPGTNQAAWMARETLEGFPGKDKKPPDFYQEMFATNQENLAKANGAIKSWDDFEKAEADWRQTPKGSAPSSALSYLNFPTTLYNTRVYPLAPFACRGVIWHQGEAGPGGPYGERLVAMITQWRLLFGQDFYFVWGTLGRSTTSPPPLAPQLGSFYRSSTNGGIRKALKIFADDQRVALVELYDLGNEDTHFDQKAEAGRRFGLAALTVAYGQSHLYSGPRMVETTFAGGKVVIRFELVGDGLVYQPSIDGISGFYLRGDSGKPCWGEAKVLSPTTIEVSHPDIAEPKTVYYAAHSNPHETLFNSGGFPASPFAVNPVQIKDDPATGTLVAILEGKKDVKMQIAHVRRSGYVFQLKPEQKTKPGPVTIQAYIPGEWQGFEIESGGKPIPTTETVTAGMRYITFQAAVDSAWIIIAEAGKAAVFRSVNRF